MDYSKYKEADPVETVQRIKAILADLGIALQETVLKELEGACTVYLEDVQHNWKVFGKGTSLEYAKASGYGEAMERLQGYWAYDYTLIDDTARTYAGFYRAPDEQMCSLAEIKQVAPCAWEQMEFSWTQSGEALDDAAMIAVWEQLVGKETPLVPYWAVRQKRTVLLPDEVISKLNTSNGLAAGNAPHEALCEDLSEILERYVLTQVFTKRLTMPIIPRTSIEKAYPSLDKLIREIEARGNFRIVARDGSLGKGFPVASVALIDRDRQRYHVQYGAHPTLAIALERCLTELLEGYVPGNEELDNERLTPLEANPGTKLTSGYNRRALFTTGTAYHPPEYFTGDSSWSFAPWPNQTDFTNERGVHDMMRLLLGVADEVYVRDQGYLGFNAYRVFVPGVTTIAGWIGPQRARDDRARARLVALCDKQCDLTQDQRGEIIDFLERSDRDKQKMVTLRGGVQLPELHAAVLRDAGEHQRAADFLRTPPLGSLRYRCAAADVEFAEQGRPADRRDELLELFFGQAALDYVRLFWRGESVVKNLYRSPLRRLFVDEGVSYEEAVCNVRTRMSKLHKAMKDKMKKNMRDQTKLGELF